MPHRTCSHCGQPGRLLDFVSSHARVDYYRCDACGQVWVYDKSSADAAPQIITAGMKADA